MSKEERKYEIAEKETMGIFDPHELDITGLSNAMDIYAKEVAIEFAEWCDNNALKQHNTSALLYRLARRHKRGFGYKQAER